jgi:flagellar basal body L-ring protein FlgH
MNLLGWRLAATLALIALASGCVQHIGEYEPKRRQYKSPVDFQLIEGPIHNGSLFNPNHPGSFLFADQRAMYLGDLVTVRIKEVADAKRGATTQLSRESNVNFKIGAFFTALEQIFDISGVIRPVDIQGDNSIESSLIADAEIEFTGRGVISEKQSPGWLSRALDYAAPF